MGERQLQSVENVEYIVGEVRDCVRPCRRRRFTVPTEIDGDDIEIPRQRAKLRIPHRSVRTERPKEDKRGRARARPGRFERQRDGHGPCPFERASKMRSTMSPAWPTQAAGESSSRTTAAWRNSVITRPFNRVPAPNSPPGSGTTPRPTSR